MVGACCTAWVIWPERGSKDTPGLGGDGEEATAGKGDGEGLGGVLGLGGGVTPLDLWELPQSGEWGGAGVEMEKKNWKSAEQGRGWSGVEMKLSSRLLGLETFSVFVTSSIRSDSRDWMMGYEEHMVDADNLKH